MFNPIMDTEREEFTFNGFYRGIVVDNNDPLKSGRVKVRIYPMFAEAATADLPWAIYADPGMGGFANVGSVNIPLKDAHVFVFFENGDFRFPVYFAGAPAIQNGTPDIPTEAQSKYPHNHVIKTKSGITLELDDSAGSVRIKMSHPSGTNTEIVNGGNETITVVGVAKIDASGNIVLDAGGNVEVTAGGTVTVNATGSCTINAASVTVNSSGEVSISGGGAVSISGASVSLN
jgi:uncharacterized protein involved in type VI secretion and phage assembly